MKTPRVTDFDPDAKVPQLKSPLDGMPVIGKPKPKATSTPSTSLPEKPVIQEERQKEEQQNSASVPVRGRVPVGGRVGVGVPVPPIPKVKRVIRQRHPFDIYEDQYLRLKKIADEEKGFVNGRGMNQMVREAIDNYLKDHATSKE